jgi:PIN domain nuclease of toxin-antitoxin system
MAAAAASVFLSPVTAWEAALLARSDRIRLPATPLEWFEQLLQRPGVQLAPLEPSAAIDAVYLPGFIHGDPADRFLIATARLYDLTLVTRDRRILSYGESGAVRVLRC